MKLMTLNTHSIMEENYEEKLEKFVEVIAELKPDVFVLQESNQRIDSEIVDKSELFGCIKVDTPIKRDNNAFNVARLLKEKGLNYNWYWQSAKKGFDILDEGLAVFTTHPVCDVEYFYMSNVRDYENWKTRIAVGLTINVDGEKKSFYSVHFGWWNDEEENFKIQFENIQRHFENRKNEIIYLMGDFNSPANTRNEGYDYALSKGWYDMYQLAESKDNGVTVAEKIDGWRDKTVDENGMRIDYIFSNKPNKFKYHNVIFNGKNYAIVSDHFGIVAEE